MEGSSPARLYALLVGATLVVVGIIGFFYSSSFGSPGQVDGAFGILNVNGWHNVVHLATGLLGLAAAGYAARAYALGIGVVYIGIAVWGIALGTGHNLLGIVPINTEDSVLHILIGVTGIAAGVATRPAGAPSAKPRERPI